MPPEDIVTWPALDRRCAGCKELTLAGKGELLATIKQVVYQVVSQEMKNMVPKSVLWYQNIISGASGILLASFCSLLIYMATR